ncbi:MAG TPA: hypothetical protein VK177_06920 [Flavobacteriales bacterium]|nr:hypothetical protein [Flavobacteriales bacterium]
MKLRIHIAALIFCAAFFICCECDWKGNFITVAPEAPVVVKAKVLGFFKKNSPPADKDVDIDVKMEVEIMNVFKGKETRKKIMIWGDNGMQCRPYVSAFKKDAVYYIAMNKMNDVDYYISVCGEYYLKVKNGKVKMQGNNANETMRDMTEKEFEKLLKMKLK